MAFSVALQMYSVRDYADRDFKSTLQRIKEIGYKGIELAGLYGHTPAEVKKLADEIGLVPVSAHVSLEDMLADPDKIFTDYSEIGCTYIAISSMNKERILDEEKFNHTIKDIENLAAAAQRNGLQLLYHNHEAEFHKINGEYALDILYQSIPTELLKTQIDTCWVHVAGEDPAEYIRKYIGRSPVVHLKDFIFNKNPKETDQTGDQAEEQAKETKEEDIIISFRPLGNGVQNFPAILTAAEEAGAEWVVVEQDRPSMGKTSMECAEISRKYLKNLGI